MLSIAQTYSINKGFISNKIKDNNNNSCGNIYMGNVLSKMKNTMSQSLKRMKRRMRRDRHVEKIYEEINQEDPNIEMTMSSIII